MAHSHHLSSYKLGTTIKSPGVLLPQLSYGLFEFFIHDFETSRTFHSGRNWRWSSLESLSNGANG
tara:strand:- start:18095 stop:18289 length:195 start_codon:yes stop_codon:yes gene_type:complete